MAKSREKTVEETGDSKTKIDPYENLAKQCQTEYVMAWKHQKPKKDELEVRLRLYNNQKRKKKDVGDTTLFTIFQTVLASLYVDRLDASWEGKNEGDDEVAENLDALARYDYKKMMKDVLDFGWIWDTLFCGRGLVDLSSYIRDADKGIYLPVPQNIDFLPFLRDPDGKSINGDVFQRGASRFFGYEIKMGKQDFEEHAHIFEEINISEIKFGSGTQSLLKDAIQARDQAQGLQTTIQKQESMLGANARYDITQWNTHYEIKGKVQKVKVWLANDRDKVIGLQVLKDERWSVIDRPLYPSSYDWDGTSICDLTEDKQRARAVAQNLGLKAMQADMYPNYIYDSNKIVNRKDLKFAFNKFIPIDAKGENINTAIAPLNKARPNMGLLDFIYTSLDVSAQKATATPDIQQGIQSEKDRPLGETNLLASRVDTRYSLSAKVFGWSERDFWRQWYSIYKENFEGDIDEKTIRLVGAFGAKYRKLRRSNIITKFDPDVSIESQVVSRAKQLEERLALTSYFSLALQEPTSNRRWGLKKLGKLNGLEKDEIDRLFPKTIDERIAEDENEKLSNDETVPVSVDDDHNVHLETHNKAAETPATFAHDKTHEKALSIKKVQPELFPQDEDVTAFQAPAGSPQIAVPSAPEGAKPIQPSQTSGSPA